jgi:glycosyltransferase involved in cell wall biosynthesis
MRIAFISFEYPPDTAVGGIATYVGQAAAMLAQRGHEVEVFSASPDRAGTFEENGIRVHRVIASDRKRFRFAIGPVYAARASQARFDVLEGPEYMADAAEAARLCSSAALVVRLHTPSFVIDDMMRPPIPRALRWRTEFGAWRRKSRAPWWVDHGSDVEHLHARDADLITAPSHAVVAITARRWDIDPSAVSVVPNVYQPDEKLLSIETEVRRNTVTFIGRIERRKGVIDLVDAIPTVLRQFPEARFRFVGKPSRSPSGSGTMVDFLRARLGGAAGAVEFVPHVSRQGMAEILAGTDICVFPSIWENFAYTCLEAMAAGRGVVASSSGGMAEIIRNGQTGLLVPPRSPARIARAVVSMLKDPAERVRMGKAARQDVLDRFSFKTLAPMQEACYQQAIENRARRLARSPAKPSPLISVLMPVYNTSAYLRQAIDSILAQDLGDFEFLILDDGSSDGSKKIIAEYAGTDSRIRFLPLPHQGYVPILCHWLEWTRGEFIARMDSDDVAMPQRFSHQIQYLRDHPECVIVGSRVRGIDPLGAFLFDSDHPLAHEEIDAMLMRGSGWGIVHPVAMMRREAALAVGGYRAPYAYAEDLDLFLRLAEYGKLANLPEILLQYRQHTASVNRTRQPAQARSIEAAVRDACARRGITLPPDWRYQPKALLPANVQLRNWAWRAMKEGNVPAARKHAMALLQTAPLSVESWRTLLCAIRGY